MLSTLALGGFVYLAVRHQILADFDERITEETDSLRATFARNGRSRLAEMIEARGSGGGGLAYRLESADGERLAGDLPAPTEQGGGRLGWVELREADDDETADGRLETVRALVSRLSDGSILVVGDERRRSDEALRAALWAFGWATAATLALGVAGGLWLSAHFLRRVDSMRLTAHAIMAGDWSRRIPLSPVDDDLSSLARTFNRLFDRIEKLLLAHKHVSADIAHDLRKPLASILRRLESAKGETGHPGVAGDALDEAITGVENVLETFNALLRIGQIEAGARRAAFRPVDLAEIASETAEAFRPSAEEEGKSIALDVEPLPIAGDRELLTQMVANLIDNALRHTPPGVRIEVSCRRVPSGASLSVSDNGPGVGAHEMKAIFERFYRGERAQPLPGGGLGLSLVAAIAELHDLECAASDNHPGLRVTLTSAAHAE